MEKMVPACSPGPCTSPGIDSNLYMWAGDPLRRNTYSGGRHLRRQETSEEQGRVETEKHDRLHEQVQECAACMDMFNANLMACLPCTHWYCRNDLRSQGRRPPRATRLRPALRLARGHRCRLVASGLGCATPWQNECYCRTDLNTIVSGFQTSCWPALHAWAAPGPDVASVVAAVRCAYCTESNGLDITAYEAAAPVTGIAGQTTAGAARKYPCLFGLEGRVVGG